MFHSIINDKTLNAKKRVIALADWLKSNPKKLPELLIHAHQSKDPVKADILEAIEHITLEQPDFGNDTLVQFAEENLLAKAPRVRWEAARLIANVIPQYPQHARNLINPLLENSEHEGTVVRWSAAQALTSILKCDSKSQDLLVPAIKIILKREEKDSIKKIYLKTLKGLKIEV